MHEIRCVGPIHFDEGQLNVEDSEVRLVVTTALELKKIIDTKDVMPVIPAICQPEVP